MSYLDLPRLHFSGLFFTNPNTINNVTQNPNAMIPGWRCSQTRKKT